MRSLLIALAPLWLTVALAFASPARAKSPLEGLSPAQRPRLKTIYSSVHDLQAFVKKDVRGLVLVFVGTECPVAQQYLPRLAKLSAEYRTQRVQFMAIYSDVGTNVLDMATHAHDQAIPFPALKDVDHRLADLLEVQVTPEVVVLNAKLEKVYQGAIDDQFSPHGRRAAAGEEYLSTALEALVKGEPAEPSYVAAAGCPLERREPQKSPREVTYYKDVAPLVQKHCQSCHRNGGPGPFELVSFDDVAYNAEKIREVIIDRRMPPWHGFLNPEFGQLAHNQQLAPQELETFIGWIDAGAPEGNAADAPPPVKWPKPEEWNIGQPDFVFKMKEPFRVPKSGTLEYQFFRVKLDAPEDRWFRAVEIKPGNAEVVHHITLHVAPSLKQTQLGGFAVMAQLYGLTGEAAQLLNDYVPGDSYNAKTYPAHQAVLIPKHSDLVFEVHYTPNNKAEVSDQSMVGFQWAEGVPEEKVLTKVFRKAAGRFRVPPHESHYVVEDTYYFEQDVDLDAIRPHAHMRGKSFRLELIDRDPNTDEIVNRRTILAVPIFDPGWQRTYELDRPIRLAAGTELISTGIYDNSWLNPNNPDPTQEVVWGQQTSDEMFSTRFKYRLVEKNAN